MWSDLHRTMLQIEELHCEVNALLDFYHNVNNAYMVTPMTMASWRRLMKELP